MKHLKRNLLIAFGVLLLLAAAFVFAIYWQPATTDTESTATTNPNADTIPGIPAEDIREVSVTQGDVTYTITKNDDETYTLSGIPLELSQSVLSVQFAALSSFTTEEAPITINGREADFGLTSPTAVVRQRSNTEEAVFLLGASVPGGDGTYFAPQDSAYVYILSSNQTSSILRDLSAQKSTSIMTLDPDTVTSCMLTSHQTVLFDTRRYQEGDKIINSVNSSWVMTAPYFEGVSADRFREFLESFKEVTALSFVADNIEDEEQYFQTTDYLLTYQTNTGETHSLRVGDSDASGNVYACYDANGSIFTISSSFLSVLQTDPVYFIEKLVAIFHLDDLASVRLQSGDKQYLMEISQNTDTASATDTPNNTGTEFSMNQETDNSDENSSAYTYTLNGTVTDETAFQQAYQKIAGILFQEMYTGEVSGEPVLQITYTLNDGSTDVTSYYSLDERNYVAVRSNGTKVLVLKNYLDELFILLQ